MDNLEITYNKPVNNNRLFLNYCYNIWITFKALELKPVDSPAVQ